jgi:GAF domain-containing protein
VENTGLSAKHASCFPKNGVTPQHDSLLWTLEEISHLVSHSGHPQETLGNIVQLIQRTFDTDVCSVYLLEPDRAVGRAGRARRRTTATPGRRRCHPAPAVQVFQGGGRGSVPLVPGGTAHRTSGQKIVLNGGLNLSILDGWWAEAYDGHNGFAIGRGETHTSPEVHDARDAEALVNVLRDEVIPLYYDRDHDGLPRRWIARMKRAIRTLGWRFSADRMVTDYVLKAYIPAAGGTSSEMRS